MASKRRNMFQKKKTQETTENVRPGIDCIISKFSLSDGLHSGTVAGTWLGRGCGIGLGPILKRAIKDNENIAFPLGGPPSGGGGANTAPSLDGPTRSTPDTAVGRR
ncbi:hypothetical protein AAG570_003478 [Ranatra chinensis]|uniref:Uncharacterized protein n=1 Tax=Ranatra chinensis TaxID=642074 RepID=A0ABD0Y450_9HEMI